jgi:diguanylate cyclase (GGDEF)-like protein
MEGLCGVNSEFNQDSITYEEQRLLSLRNLNLLDTGVDARLDNITYIASRLLESKYCMMSLIDKNRQWFKSSVGPIENLLTGREQSFCTHTIQEPSGILLVKDTCEDPRFVNNPMVTGKAAIRFYFGVAIKSKEGYPIGVLCVKDTQPLDVTAEDIQAFKHLVTCIEHDILKTQESCTDPLTGVPNRRGFLSMMSSVVQMAASKHSPLSTLYIDLDDLKLINDNMNHECGDQALVAVSSAILHAIDHVEQFALACRIGGDEFCVLCIGEYQDTCCKISRIINEYLEGYNANAKFNISVSMGGSEHNSKYIDSFDFNILSSAEEKMMQSKRSKKQCVNYDFSDCNDSVCAFEE